MLDKLVGLAMLVASSIVFLYYSIWTLLMVRAHPQLAYTCRPRIYSHRRILTQLTKSRPLLVQPFVDSDHPLQNFFPPRVWAIRIPVILVLLGCAVVGSFLSVVMIRSNRKKAAKAKAQAKKKA
ncbi:dolichol phosphate-mannose biosynthesis regulatory protein [Podospora appendiculata]|uniref:Dolichol phosphate-mannose biosynthesis regulatory protein n=1 Tax=Podospora appendiculata TaxID=314037 RepID=A0AAE0XG88_9PEZI|nr:dolichol phosphate-mannose biosynthesis regulatory protein [Podospora appendiculata]